MESLYLLHSRQSNSQLQAPAPEPFALNQILQAGMRVPDHGGLMPWRFTVVSDGGLAKLSDIFVTAVKQSGADEAKLEKTANMPFRAPLIIVVSTALCEHPKVPKQEQVIAAGCTVHAMQMAAYALGYGAIWRTGELSLHPYVKSALNVAEQDEIVGFLYIGTQSKSQALKPAKDFAPVTNYLI